MAPLNWDNIEIIAEDESIVRITDWSRVEIVSEDGDLIKTCDNDVYNIEACDRMIVFSGQPGAAATIRVGTVTTLPAGSDATVTNRGTPEAAIFDFGIPKGADGASEWGDIGGTLSDQTDLQNALNAKANTADLGDLATKDSVDYETEVTNKPSLGTMSAEDASDYYTKSATDTLLLDKAPVILNSASGSVASFSDGSPAPVTALTVGIEPVQDLHGYDHPWPGGGGNNLFNMDDVTDPVPATNSNLYIQAKASTTYTASTNMPHWVGTAANVLVGKNSGSFSTDVNGICLGKNVTFTTDADGIIRVLYRNLEVNGLTSDEFLASHIQIEEGSTATSWTPYSNICPISGHTSATVNRIRKNFIKYTTQSRTAKGITATVNADGSVTLDGTATATNVPIYNMNLAYANSIQCDNVKHLPNGRYRRPVYDVNEGWAIQVYGSNVENATATDAYSISNYNGSEYFDIDDTYKYNWIRIWIKNGASFSNKVVYPWIYRADETDLTWEGYNGTSVTVDLDGTRYGGTLNVLTGVLTINWVCYNGTDFTSVSKSGSGAIGTTMTFQVKLTDNNMPLPYTRTSVATTTNIISNRFSKNIPSGTPGRMVLNTTYLFGVIATSELSTVDGAGVKAWFASHPSQFVYELATPFTVQLSPSTLSTLKGDNAIWSSTGNTNVTYRADTKLFVERLTKPTEDDMVANSNIASGKYFTIGNSLYLATQSIASGDAIVPGTNCTRLSIADALNNINS